MRKHPTKQPKAIITEPTAKSLYLNRPIAEPEADKIGMGVYVDYIEDAMHKGANMIAVISEYGTGKSSLIELLERKYNGEEPPENGRRSTIREYCHVNLWSQLEQNTIPITDKDATNTKSDTAADNATLQLHRNFLYQIVSMLFPG